MGYQQFRVIVSLFVYIYIFISIAVGRLFVNKTIPKSFEEIETNLKFVNQGGWWEPIHCKAPKKVAIIIPYRNRKNNLMVTLRHLHPILKRQQISYRIYLVEQVDTYPFNKGKLLNIGYEVSKRYGNYSCIVFHDADFLPTNDENYYDCPTSPRHMSPAVELFGYKQQYGAFLGGVVALSQQDVEGIFC